MEHHYMARVDGEWIVTDSPYVPANTISWPSALGALLPIALNSMIQPSGMVCGMPSTYGFFLRSSPFMCILDAIYILAQRLVLGYRSPATAVETIVNRRYRDTSASTILSNLKTTSAFRLLIFFLGALPQAVRLVFIRGVPWTQALAAMYFGSFLVIEFLVVFKSIHLPFEEPPSTEKSTKSLNLEARETTSNQEPPVAETSTSNATIQNPDSATTTCYDEYENWMAMLSMGISNGLILGLLLPISYEVIEMPQPMRYDLHSSLSLSSKLTLSFLIRGLVFSPFIRAYAREVFTRTANDETTNISYLSIYIISFFTLVTTDWTILFRAQTFYVMLLFVVGAWCSRMMKTRTTKHTSYLYMHMIYVSTSMIMGSEVVLRWQNFWGMLLLVNCASCLWMLGRNVWGVTSFKHMLVGDKWLFLAEHLLAVVLWYRFKYNPYYTVKPEWTAVVSYKV